MTEHILEIIAQSIGSNEDLSHISSETFLKSMGFTSHNYMMCLFKLEEELGRTFEDENSLFMNVKTWHDLCCLIEG